MPAFPYILENTWNLGATEFDTAITDTQSKSLGYMHFSESIPKFGVCPYYGAWTWGVDLSQGTKTTAVNQTQAAFNVAATEYWSVGFAFLLKSSGLVMATTNRFTIASCISTATEETVLDILYTTAAGYELVIAETNATAAAVKSQFTLDQWHWVELYGVNDPGANDGTSTLVYDGTVIGTISSLNQGAFTDLYLGAINQDAGTTGGYLFFGPVIVSGVDTSAVRVGYRDRAPINPHISKSRQVFVGPGTVSRMQLLTATAGDYIRLYDTDRGYTTGTYGIEAEATVEANTDIWGPISFHRGCYAVISGSDPRALVSIDRGEHCGYPQAVCYGNDAVLKHYARTRTERSGNR